MTLRNVYAVLWIAWLTSFLVIELSAMWTGHSEATLSEFVWRAEQLGRAWTFLRFFICAFCLWLFFHMAFGWFR
jgi:hypothetical protein